MCPAGEQCLENTCISCMLCPSGQYKAIKGTQECDQCEQGKYNPLEGKTSAGDCLSCPAGSDTTSPGKTSQEDCACKKEFYARGNASLGTLSCQNCPAGAVCNTDRSCALRNGPEGMGCSDGQVIHGNWAKDSSGVYSIVSCPTGLTSHSLPIPNHAHFRGGMNESDD